MDGAKYFDELMTNKWAWCGQPLDYGLYPLTCKNQNCGKCVFQRMHDNRNDWIKIWSLNHESN